ncbi:MAG: hypothetical protein U0838_09495 [Chloroflexota bacterium]
MNRLATAAVALLLIPLLAGCAAPPPAATPAPTAAPSAPTAIQPGTHTTTSFKPATTYTVPAGWTSVADSAGYFGITLASDPDNGFYLFHNVQALSQDPSCPKAPEPGVGTSSAALVTWIRSLKGLNVSQPMMVKLGGLPATQIDVSIHADWTPSCSFANGLRTVALFYSDAINWWLAGDEKLRLTIVDIPNGGTVVADLDSFSGKGFGDLLSSGTPIVQSLQFATQ